MAFERIKARIGWSESTERYADTDDYTPPEEVEDPHTIDDSTRETWLDKLLANRWWALSVALLALAGLVAGVIYFGRYFATLLMNPWVQRFGVAAVLVAIARRSGREDERQQFENEHELTLYDPKKRQSTHFRGRYEAVKGASHDVFVPFKGRRGTDPEPYRVRELSKTLARKFNRDADEEVRIRLHPKVTTVQRTEAGLKVTQLTTSRDNDDSALQPDPWGDESNLKAPLPDMAATETVTDLKDTIEELEEENSNLKNKQDQLRRQRENALELAGKNFEEIRDLIEKDADLFSQFVYRGQRTSSSDDEQTRSNGTERAQSLAGGDSE